jgi:hypothetical protein
LVGITVRGRVLDRRHGRFRSSTADAGSGYPQFVRVGEIEEKRARQGHSLHRADLAQAH